MVALPEPPPRRMSPQEFLEWEKTQELRYEYVDGEVVAMTGGTIPHNDLALNLYRPLYDHVRSRGCRVNVADVKVKTRQRFRYPDVVVTCDPRDKDAIQLFQYPTVIVEVLSPSTEALDRGEKLREYQALPSLQEYVLINSLQAVVEVYRRGDGRTWEYESYEMGDDLTLKSVEFSCAIADLYAGIALPEVPDEPEDEMV